MSRDEGNVGPTSPSADETLVPRLGIYAHSSLAGYLAEQGFDWIELAVAELRPELPESAARPFLDCLEALPIRPEVFDRLFLPTMRLVGDNVDLGRIADHLGTTFSRARRLGAEWVVWGSGPSRRVERGLSRERAYDQIVEAGRLIAREAGAAGIGVVLEPLGRRYCNIVNTVEDGLRLLADIGSPALGLLADTDHLESEGDPFSRLAEVGPLLRHVHLAEASRVQPGTMPRRRAFYSSLFAELKRLGYRDRIALEADLVDIGQPLGGMLAMFKGWWRDA
jgi:sugar phosphate isomerase/epimerase